jgi:hexosaminidase
MPAPRSVRFLPGRHGLPEAPDARFQRFVDERLRAAVARALRRLLLRTGRGVRLNVECSGPGCHVPSLAEDESYALTVTDEGALLRAPTTVGALRGLETLLQLVERDTGGWYLPAASIEDRPRFPWRGLLLDVCRHFLPLEVLRRNLDGMAAVKMNVLHLHLTEDQAFRMESRRFPRLHALGSDGRFFTQDEIVDLVRYAADRGIRVVPELDMPGHVTSWLVGHPELASAPGPYELQRTYRIFDPTLDPTREEVYAFLEELLGEVAGLFPDAFFHIGGDEVTGRHWSASPAIQAFQREHGLADAHALQAHFNRRLAEILARLGKRMVGWDEILQPGLPRDAVVQSWRGPAALAEAARHGHEGLLSFGYYLDHQMPAAFHYAADPLPAGNDLDEAAAARVLGGEACMWSEYVTEETIDSRTWPRLAAIAERLWSPGDLGDTADMYRRLEGTSERLAELALAHAGHTQVMATRLVGAHSAGSLVALLDLCEPVKVYRRAELQPVTTSTPLTGLVDAARPDSSAARRFASRVEALSAGEPAEREAIESALREWRELLPLIEELAARAPALAGATGVARALDRAAAVGLDALGRLGAPADAAWCAEKLALLAEVAEPKALLEIAVVPALRQLVELAGRG